MPKLRAVFKSTFLVVSLILVLSACDIPKTCIERALATAQVVEQKMDVRIAYGWYSPDPLKVPGRYHVECQARRNTWNFYRLRDGRLVNVGRAIFGFDVKKYFSLAEFKQMMLVSDWS